MEEEAESEKKSDGKEKTRGGRFTLDAGTPSACEDRR